MTSRPVRGLVVTAIVAGAYLLLVLVVLRYGVPLALVGGVGLAAVFFVLTSVELSTALLVFLIYTNILVLVMRAYHLPQWMAASPILLLGVPVAIKLILRGERLRVDGGFLMMLLLLGVMLLAATRARDTQLALGEIGTYVVEGLGLYWLLLNAIRGRRVLRRAVWAMVIAGGLLGGLTAVQAVTGSYDRDFGGLAGRQLKYVAKVQNAESQGPSAVEVRRADRADGPVGDPNRFAQILVVLIPVAVALLRRARSRRARWSAGVAAVLVLSGVLLTYSRGAFIALLVLGLGMAAVGWVRLSRIAAALVVLAGMVTVLAPGYYTRVGSLGNVSKLLGDRPTAGADGSIRGRATEMLAAFHAFLDHPVIGVGPGQYLRFYSVEYQQSPSTQFRNIEKPRRAHTLYFELAAETGSLGLALFLAIVGNLLLQLWRTRRISGDLPEGEELSDLAAGLCLGILAYLITAVFLQLSFERYYWMLLGVAAATLHVMASERSGSANRSTLVPSGSPMLGARRLAHRASPRRPARVP